MYAVGLLFCVLPACLAVRSYFPLWKENPAVMASGVMVSAASVTLMVCVALPPLAKRLKMLLGKTPSAWVGFGILAAVCKAISLVIDAMYVIFFIAALGNLCGQLFFWQGNKYLKLSEDENE